MIRVQVRSDLTNLNTLDREFPRNVDNATRRGAERMVEIIHISWSPNSPSPRGAPPAVVTGTLDRSVTPDKVGRDILGHFAGRTETVMWAARVGAPYAWALEDESELNRPYVLPAALQVEQEMKDLYKGVFNIRWR